MTITRPTRARAGWYLLAVVILMMLVVPQFQGKIVAGTAIVGQVPGPPAVDACVAGGQVAHVLTVERGDEPLGGDLAAYPPLDSASCTGTHAGEVVAVMMDPATTVTQFRLPGGDDQLFSGDPNGPQCAEAVMTYLGIDQTPQGTWQRVVNVWVPLAAPTLLQTAFRQRWAACTVQLIAPSGNVAPNYPGSLRGAAVNGAERNLIGQCQNVSLAAVACNAPHVLERFFMQVTLAASDRADQLRTCERQVRKVIGLTPGKPSSPAFTVDVQVFAGPFDASGDDTIAAHSLLSCSAHSVGSGQLRGSLIATAHG